MAYFSFNGEYIFYSAPVPQYIFKKYWPEYYTLCQDVVVTAYSNDKTLENLKCSIQIY